MILEERGVEGDWRWGGEGVVGEGVEGGGRWEVEWGGMEGVSVGVGRSGWGVDRRGVGWGRWSGEEWRRRTEDLRRREKT